MKRHLTRWTTLLMTLLLVSGCGYNALQVKEAVFKAWATSSEPAAARRRFPTWWNGQGYAKHERETWRR